MAAIALKVLIAAAGAVLSAWVLHSRSWMELPERAFLRRMVAVQLAFSLGLFVALYIVGGQQVTSDVPGYYLPAAHAVLAGHLPFRDFALSYAPLFPYVGAALAFLWDSGKVFALFAILMNAMALLFWHWTANECLDDLAARQTSVFYATSGNVIVQTLLGTNQIWVAAALAGSSLLLVRRASASSGLVQALALCTSKILVLLFWPVLWIWAAHRGRWLTAALAASAAVYGCFAAAGADVLAPLRSENELISPGNLPYLLGGVLRMQNHSGKYLFDALALAVLASTVGWLYIRTPHQSPQSRPQWLMAAIALLGVVFMLVSKKSFTGYAVFFMYPAILILNLRLSDLRARVGFLLIFNVLLASEPSFWFHFGGNGLPLRDWLRESGGLGPWLFIAIDVALLGCYAYLAALSVQCARQDFLQSPMTHNRP